MKAFIYAALMAVNFLAACAPLPQAPLLYSSKTAVGLDISTSTTESPGGSISIGVKVVDAAYVPVAVSKRLRDDPNSPVSPHDIVLIQAVFGEGLTAGKLDSLTEENKKKITDFLNAKVKETTSADELKRLDTDQVNRKIERDKYDATIANLKNQVDLRPAADATNAAKNATEEAEKATASAKQMTETAKQASVAAYDADKAAIAAAKQATDDAERATAAARALTVAAKKATDTAKSNSDEFSNAQTMSNSLKREIESAEQALVNKRKQVAVDKAESDRLFSAAAEAASILRTDKKDALSVYGRFDSNSTGSVGSSTSAKLTAGKIFSTGVASQNLTEAVKQEAIGNSSAAIVGGAAVCLNSLAELIKDQSIEMKAKLLDKYDSVCVPKLLPESKK